MRFIDLFCGIGGFHEAARLVSEQSGVDLECVLACDIDKACQKAYQANFGIAPYGDIADICGELVPDHDLLFAGFPCQPFSIIGDMKGFEDTRGTLFFHIARLLEAKRPKAFVLENVKMLVGHRNGATFATILDCLQTLGYSVSFRVLNALDFGLPQKRERVFIVGFDQPRHFVWPTGGTPMRPLGELLEAHVPSKYYASDYIRKKREEWHQADHAPTVWHENKAGNISKYPYSCALRAGASYNYLLVDGCRRFTEREMLRLQGFPDTYQIVNTYSEVRRQTGNSVAVPVVAAVLSQVLNAISQERAGRYERPLGQFELVMEQLHAT